MKILSSVQNEKYVLIEFYNAFLNGMELNKKKEEIIQKRKKFETI